MNLKSFAVILGGALFLTTGAALPQTQTGPIHIDGVSMYGGNSESSADQTVITPGSVKIAFTNNRNVPAKRVRFVLVSGSAIVDRSDDVGTFSKGVTINYSFPTDAYKSISSAAVQKVNFADGTVWHNPNVPAEHTKMNRQIPGSVPVAGN
jgi:hypothetical protein